MNRLHLLKQQFLNQSCDAVIISHKENITYYTGLLPLHSTERESFLLVTPKTTVLYHSPFIKPPTNNPHLLCIPMTSLHPFQSVIKTYGKNVSTMGIEKNNLTVLELERLQTMMPDVTFNAIDDLPTHARKIKDKDEIIQIKKARRITIKTLKWIQKYCSTKEAQGITETELRQRIENQMMHFGADTVAFPTIVAFNNHTAFPHHVPGNRKLTPNSIMLVDLGAKVHGYCADMTRTWCVGTPTPLFLHIESIVKAAHKTAKKMLSEPHVTASRIDQAARQIISKAGYADNFIHSTGHGIGLEAHETPSISSGNQTMLESTMVITIEPGIYIPGKFGYRHEDTVIIV